MLKTYLPKTLFVIASCLSLLSIGCTRQTGSLSENDLKDLSGHAVSLNTSNRFTLYPLIEAKLVDSPNPEFHSSVLEIAMVLDTLAMKYIEQTGGIAENGSMMNPLESGEKGIQLYQQLNTKEKLSSLLTKTQSHASPADNRLMRATTYILQQRFLNEAPYFNQEKLTQTPLSVLSLELLVLENQLCSILLEELSENNQ